MKLPHGAHVAVVDGSRFIWLSNIGDDVHPQLNHLGSPDLDPTNRSQGKMRHSITTSQNAGNDLDEAAHVAAAADWINHQAMTNKIEQLVIVADKRSLGELRRHYHLELEKRLIGEVGKALTNHPLTDIEQAITDA
ncbi:host attachment protein [Sphingorhabdus sp.]|uniref:baeRF12 domain-containing protein n=1 Tax=Sphingorhabdus sp. TaxID=1902408 RepID=UPI00391CEB31